ncbi:hypothetical protein NKI19_26690 [Mesorhizobium sp. M0751]|uniref:hypothetical protein n=1 Tax=unclassified Mesorhizobium TaxID=325217 RepID=UPI0033371DBF
MVIVPHELKLGESRFVRYREGRDCASSACIEQAVNSPAFVGWQGRKLKGHQNGIDLQSVFTIRFYLSRSGKVLSTAHKGLLQTMERAFLCHLGDGSNNAVYRKTVRKAVRLVRWLGLVVRMGRPKAGRFRATLCPRQAGPKLGYGVTARNLVDS